jgi:hypothetical protein
MRAGDQFYLDFDLDIREILLMKIVLFASLAVGSFFFAMQAIAMDAFEIQVYDAEINTPGKSTLETHINTVPSGVPTSGYQGQVPNHQMSHLTFEGALGMTDFWELGAYLQTALLPNGNYDFAGAKLRTKFVVPKKTTEPWQFGANFEIAYVPFNFEQYLWAAEIRPILGYTVDRFAFTINPIIGINLVPNLAQAPDFGPCAKVVVDTHRGFGLGLEYYADFGAMPNATAIGQSEQYLFAAIDLLEGPLELNAGLGGGLNWPANVYSNATVAKLILGTEL